MNWEPYNESKYPWTRNITDHTVLYSKISPQGRFLFSCAEQNTERNPSQPEPVQYPKRRSGSRAEGGERSAHTKALIHKKDYKWPNTEPYVEPFEGIATKT